MRVHSGATATILAAVTAMTAPGQDDAGSPDPVAVTVQPVTLALDDGSEVVSVGDHFDLEAVAKIWDAAGIALSFSSPLQLNSSGLFDLTLAERDGDGTQAGKDPSAPGLSWTPSRRAPSLRYSSTS